MSAYKQYGTDVSKEVEGVVVELGTNEDGTVYSATVSRAGKANKAYQTALTKATSPYQRQIANGTLDPVLSEKIYLEVFCKTVLKGWTNMRDENDNELLFTVENAIKVMTDLPELYMELATKANTAATFKAEDLEEGAKN